MVTSKQPAEEHKAVTVALSPLWTESPTVLTDGVCEEHASHPSFFSILWVTPPQRTTWNPKTTGL